MVFKLILCYKSKTDDLKSNDNNFIINKNYSVIILLKNVLTGFCYKEGSEDWSKALKFRAFSDNLKISFRENML